MKQAPPRDDELLALLIGRSGFLRAPTLRVGKKLLVGFSADAYTDVLGGRRT
jgi:hypothetical protein